MREWFEIQPGPLADTDELKTVDTEFICRGCDKVYLREQLDER